MLRHGAHAGDRQELGVDDVEEVAGGEAVSRCEDVGLAPADELLAGFDGEFAVCIGGAQASDVECRAAAGAVEEREVGAGLLVGVVARVYSGGEAEIGELVESFVTEESISNGVLRIVGRGLRVHERAGLQESTL